MACRRILKGLEKKNGPMQIPSSANTRFCPRDDIAHDQGTNFAEDLDRPMHKQFNISQGCTLAAKVFTHRSCCTVGKNTFTLCPALVKAHWESQVHFEASIKKDTSRLQRAPRKNPQVSRQMEHRTYTRHLTQVAYADGLSSKLHSDRKRCNGHK